MMFASLAFAPVSAYAKNFGDYRGAEYVRNYDGDTVTFNLPGLHPLAGEEGRILKLKWYHSLIKNFADWGVRGVVVDKSWRKPVHQNHPGTV